MIAVKYYNLIRDATGVSEERVETGRMKLVDLLQYLATRHPGELGDLFFYKGSVSPALLVLINGATVVEPETRCVEDSDEVCLLSAVGGG